jgi:flagellar protein FlgJ
MHSLEALNALAIDGRSLDGLRTKARRDPDGALKAAAREFEAVFMEMVLKSMRQAAVAQASLEGHGFGGSEVRTYQGMLDQQLARDAASRGLGLAQRLVEQLSRSQPPRVERTPLSSTTSVSTVSVQDAPASAPASFVEQLWPHAEAAARALGLPPRFVLGHAALESGWGRYEIRHPDGRPSHNLFGIKAGAGWKGETVEVVTTEYVDGRAERRRERFRAYSSYAEAFADYARLLAANPRYAPVLAHGGDADAFARALAQAGYATDPLYARKLSAVLRSPALSTPVAG